MAEPSAPSQNAALSLQGRTFTLPKLGACKLDKRLGGGRLSEVYLGKLNDEKQIALKIARGDLSAAQTVGFRNEFDTLKILRSKAQDLDLPPAYFPEPKDYAAECITADGRFSLLALELIDADSLRDAISCRPKPGEREQLALQSGKQYAEMLMILHGAGLTCTDRKPDDIYWRSPEGPIVVLDWNVVNKGDSGRQTDLELFGLIWYELLVGQKVARRLIGDRFERDLEAASRWRDESILSEGVKRILTQAIRREYPTAEALKDAIEAHLERWSGPASELKQGNDLVALDIAVRLNPDDDDLVRRVRRLRDEAAGKGERNLRQAREALGASTPDYDRALHLLSDTHATLHGKDQEFRRAEAIRLSVIASACTRAGPDASPPAPLVHTLVANIGNPVDALESLDVLVRERPGLKEKGLAWLQEELKVQKALADAERAEGDEDFLSAGRQYALAANSAREFKRATLVWVDDRHSIPDAGAMLASLWPNLRERWLATERRRQVAEALLLVERSVELASSGDWPGAQRWLQRASLWADVDGHMQKALKQVKALLDVWQRVPGILATSPVREAINVAEFLAKLAGCDHAWGTLQSELDEWGRVEGDALPRGRLGNLKDKIGQALGLQRNRLRDALLTRVYVAVAGGDEERPEDALERLAEYVRQYPAEGTTCCYHLDELVREEERLAKHFEALKNFLPEADSLASLPGTSHAGLAEVLKQWLRQRDLSSDAQGSHEIETRG